MLKKLHILSNLVQDTFIQPLLYKKEATQGQFLRKLNRFEFRVFLLDWFPNQG